MSSARTTPLPRPPRGWRRGLSAVAAALLFNWCASPYAVAEVPVASEPRAREELTGAPGWVTLAFADEVDPGSAKVLVLDDAGRNVTTGGLIVEGTNVTTQLQDDLPEDTYTVRYRITGSDGEPTGGAYQFAYGPGLWTELPDRSWAGRDDEPAVLRNEDPNATTAAPRPSAQAPTSVPGVELSRRNEEPTPSVSPTPRATTATASAGSGSPSPTVSVTPAPSAPGSPSATPTGTPSEGSAVGTFLLAALAFGVAALVIAAARAVRRRNPAA